MNDYLIVALQNPKEYKYTRHNIGSECVRNFLKKEGCEFDSDKSLSGITFNGLKYLFSPNFINNTGNDLKDLIKNINPTSIIVVHDEVLLDVGTFRIKKGFNNSTHNGVISIKEVVGEDFWRIRIGIGRKDNLKKYVLEEFGDDEHSKILGEFYKLYKPFSEKLISEGMESAKVIFNQP